MRTRVLFVVWVVATLYFLAIAVSDFTFGKGDVKALAVRAVLCFVWPLAILSAAGRKVLFTNTRKI